MSLPGNDSEAQKEIYYARLEAIGVNVDAVKEFSPTATQLQQFCEGLETILKKTANSQDESGRSSHNYVGNSA
jgi:hypothetical protein